MLVVVLNLGNLILLFPLIGYLLLDIDIGLSLGVIENFIVFLGLGIVLSEFYSENLDS